MEASIGLLTGVKTRQGYCVFVAMRSRRFLPAACWGGPGAGGYVHPRDEGSQGEGGLGGRRRVWSLAAFPQGCHSSQRPALVLRVAI